MSLLAEHYRYRLCISDQFPIVAAAIPAHPRTFVADAVVTCVMARSRERHADRQHRMAAREHQCVATLRTSPRIPVSRWRSQGPSLR